MVTPVTNMTPHSTPVGTGTARAALGSASGKTHSVPASSSRRGFQRVISRPPAIVPAPNAARASPQGPAPPKLSRATSGPYTASAAPTTALATENWITMPHSQGRDANSCQPSRRSASMPPPGSRGAMPRTSSSARREAATAKAAASTASTQPGPMAATIAPPSAAPPSEAPCMAIR